MNDINFVKNCDGSECRKCMTCEKQKPNIRQFKMITADIHSAPGRSRLSEVIRVNDISVK